MNKEFISKEHNHDPNDPNNFEGLEELKQNVLLSWIKENLQQRKSFNYERTSYQLKHSFEKRGGFYVTNNAFKAAMLKSGYRVRNMDKMNWVFDVSAIFLKK